MIVKQSKFVFFLVFILTGLNSYVNSQISFGGKPIFEHNVYDQVETKSKQLYFAPSKQQLKSVKYPTKNQSVTFAHQFTVNYTPDNSGTWEVLEDGSRIWRLQISSPGAFSINLIFDRYVLPEGAKLFIYNTDGSDVIGSFTHKNNKPNGVFATAPVKGDAIIVEYQEPKEVKAKAELLIGAVNHDYLGFYDLKSLKIGYFGDAGSCNQDIACYDVNNDLDIRRSVVKLLVGGSELCTGTMINNTKEDGTPYVITAAHCMRVDKQGSTTLLFFNYESPHCAVIEGSKADTIGTKSRSITGGETKVLVDNLDIALIEMQDKPPASYRPYYAGWTLNAEPEGPYKSIHHPSGDVKKIATFNGAVEAYSYNDIENSPYAQVDNFHWRINRWTTGTTEAGSSGGPLFEENNLFIGTLSGGQAYCGNAINDYFTQFYKAWDKNSPHNEQFKFWLDPINSGVQSLAGFDPYKENPFKRLTNVERGDIPLTKKILEGGYLTGHNAKQTSKFAESFSGIKSASIKGVYIMPYEYKWNSDQTIDLVVWQGSNSPQTVIARKNDIEIRSLKRKKEIFIEFDNPVPVSGQFYVGYEINYSGSPVDTFAVYHSESTSKINNSLMVYHTDWEKASDVYDTEKKYTLWIDVLADMVVYGDTQVTPTDDDNMSLYPVPVLGNDVYLNSKNQFVEYVEIIGINGHVLSLKQINENSSRISIDVSTLPSGVYVIKIILKDKEVIRKIVVSKKGT